ncbi:unnamed protein product, partial [Amoebophrya sp. A120]
VKVVGRRRILIQVGQDLLLRCRQVKNITRKWPTYRAKQCWAYVQSKNRYTPARARGPSPAYPGSALPQLEFQGSAAARCRIRSRPALCIGSAAPEDTQRRGSRFVVAAGIEGGTRERLICKKSSGCFRKSGPRATLAR